MNNNFKNECSKFIRGEKCKPCKKLKKENIKFFEINNLNSKEGKQITKNIDKYTSKCEKCKEKKFKQCDLNNYLNNYLEYSGASIGKCD